MSLFLVGLADLVNPENVLETLALLLFIVEQGHASYDMGIHFLPDRDNRTFRRITPFKTFSEILSYPR
jgi:hypothetical protein